MNRRFPKGYNYYGRSTKTLSSKLTLGQKWRLVILQDNPCCNICGKLGEQVHHRDENRENNNLSNLQILCVKCHKHVHRKYKKFRGRIDQGLATKHGLHLATVYRRIKNGVPLKAKKWTHHK